MASKLPSEKPFFHLEILATLLKGKNLLSALKMTRLAVALMKRHLKVVNSGDKFSRIATVDVTSCLGLSPACDLYSHVLVVMQLPVLCQ